MTFFIIDHAFFNSLNYCKTSHHKILYPSACRFEGKQVKRTVGFLLQSNVIFYR